MDLEGVKLLWVNYPHMPTGANAKQAVFEELINWARKNNILLVNDNPYSFVLTDKPQSILTTPDAMDVAMELNSLSKSFNMAGWRVGMLLGNEANIKAVLKVKSNMDSGMFYGIQKGAIAALQAPDSWFEELNKVYDKRRQLIYELATLLGSEFDTNSSGLFVWAKLKDSTLDAEAFIDKILYEYELFITPGTIFGSQGKGIH